MTAAGDASPRKQAAIIRRLIASRPDAITVVPNNPGSLERVLARARRVGIVVVTHEASNQRNTDVDIEPFDNSAFGAHPWTTWRVAWAAAARTSRSSATGLRRAIESG
jgi:simple sugar transport system substrate-binding protein